MTEDSGSLREQVAARAEHACEYCQLPDTLEVGGFEVDHIIPRSAGGSTESSNLCWSCPHCNAHKWHFTTATDSVTGFVVELFHPRQDRWHDHFRWSGEDASEIEGLTPSGRATVARLQMNAPNVVRIRRLLRELMQPYRKEPS